MNSKYAANRPSHGSSTAGNSASSSPSLSPRANRYLLRCRARSGQSPPTSSEEVGESSDGSSSEDDTPAVLQVNQRLAALVAENSRLRARAAQSHFLSPAVIAQRKLMVARSKISALKTALMASTTCGICSAVMKRPFTVQCGHSFCAPCLLQWFQRILGAKIARVPYLQRRSGDPFDCHVVPSTQDHLAYLLALIARYHIHCPRRVLSYPCPTCRTAVSIAPIESFLFTTLIAEAEVAVEVHHPAADMVDEAGVTSSGYFAGLFYDLTLALNLPPLPISRR